MAMYAAKRAGRDRVVAFTELSEPSERPTGRCPALIPL